MRNVLAAGVLLWGMLFVYQSDDELKGKVIGVSDGDTLKLLVGKESHTIRLDGIDAPETGQSFGAKSKEALSRIVFGKQITVETKDKDRYGRLIGRVLHDGEDVNARMIKDGWAWHFKEYSKDKTYAALEVEAKDAKRGLWQDDNPLSPWEFRSRQKQNKSPPSVNSKYWMNTSSGVRHNESCEHFGKTKKGRYCEANEGKPCGKCGG